MNLILQYILSFLFIFFTSLCSAQIDTLKLSQKVNSLTDIESHKKYWEDIDKSDQSHRAALTDELLDIENLISVSYYLNKYGYPKRSLFGLNSIIISVVWVHNTYPIIKKLSFPLILQGFLSKEIPEMDIRNYYLAGLYSKVFDDNELKTKPLTDIFNSLNLNISKKINIKEICEAFEACQKFKKQPRIVLGEWKEKDVNKTLYHEDNPIETHFKGVQVQIFKDPHDDYFFYRVIIDRSHYPDQLVPLNKEFTKFKYLNNVGDKYFEIGDDGNLYFKDSIGEVITKYEKVGTNK